MILVNCRLRVSWFWWFLSHKSFKTTPILFECKKGCKKLPFPLRLLLIYISSCLPVFWLCTHEFLHPVCAASRGLQPNNLHRSWVKCLAKLVRCKPPPTGSLINGANGPVENNDTYYRDLQQARGRDKKPNNRSHSEAAARLVLRQTVLGTFRRFHFMRAGNFYFMHSAMERPEQRRRLAGEMNIYRSSGVYWEIVGVLPPDFQVVGCFRHRAPFVGEVL